MRKTLLAMLLCIASLNPYAQSSQPSTFHSKMYRFFDKSNNDSQQQQAIIADHLLIIDADKKRIVTYDTKKEFDLSLISIKKEGPYGEEIYTFDCVDPLTLKECKAQLVWTDNKPFFLMLDFGQYKWQYFIEEFFTK